jgi:hypothetical protein
VVIGFGGRTIVDGPAFFKFVLRRASPSPPASTTAGSAPAAGRRFLRLLRDHKGAGGYKRTDEADEKSFHNSCPFRLLEGK